MLVRYSYSKRRVGHARRLKSSMEMIDIYIALCVSCYFQHGSLEVSIGVKWENYLVAQGNTPLVKTVSNFSILLLIELLRHVRTFLR